MKKIATVILVMLLASALFGCTQNQKTSDDFTENEEKNDEKKK